jgi:hypothetical protein
MGRPVAVAALCLSRESSWRRKASVQIAWCLLTTAKLTAK